MSKYDILFLTMAVIGLVFPTILYPIIVKKKFNNDKYPTSYSGTYSIFYKISQNTKRHFEHIFTCWTNQHCLLLTPALCYYSKDVYNSLIGVVALGSLMYVGAFPSGIKKEVTRIHCVFAELCAAFAMLWLIRQGFFVPTAIFALVCFIWAKVWQKKYETIIMEFMAFTAAYIGVIMCALKF